MVINSYGYKIHIEIWEQKLLFRKLYPLRYNRDSTHRSDKFYVEVIAASTQTQYNQPNDLIIIRNQTSRKTFSMLFVFQYWEQEE